MELLLLKHVAKVYYNILYYIFSYIIRMSAQPSTIVVGRTRNTNAEPLGVKGGGDMLLTAGIIGVSAVGGYFITDYIIKNGIVDDILDKLGLSTTGTNIEPAPEPVEEDKDKKPAQSNKAYIMTPLGPELIGEMYDRDSRQNSAYLAAKRRQFNESEKYYLDEYYDAHNTNDADYNQIVTDEDVYNHF